MIDYDEGYWSLAFAFQLHGSVIPKALVWTIPCCLMALGLHLWLRDSEHFSDSDVGAEFGALSFVLGFLIVFRSQKAYDRWWEAGSTLQQLRGEWFNAFSCLVAFGNQDPSMAEQLESFIHELVRLFSLLYGTALRQCSMCEENTFEFIDFSGIDRKHLQHLLHAHDPCEVVLQWIQRVIVEATDAKIINIAPPILSRVYNQLGSGIVKLSGARRIKMYPIPFLLAQMITFLMIIHWVATAVASALLLNDAGMVVTACFISQLCYWGVHYIAVELEGPYGGEPNDLSLETMQIDMNKSLRSLVQPLARSAPVYKFSPEADRRLNTVHIDLIKYIEQQMERDRLNEAPVDGYEARKRLDDGDGGSSPNGFRQPQGPGAAECLTDARWLSPRTLSCVEGGGRRGLASGEADAAGRPRGAGSSPGFDTGPGGLLSSSSGALVAAAPPGRGDGRAFTPERDGPVQRRQGEVVLEGLAGSVNGHLAAKRMSSPPPRSAAAPTVLASYQL